MTDLLALGFKPEGPPRAPGARAVRPRMAASLILLDRSGREPRVLMGRRHAGHSFMPNLWVFPGGRVERGDARAPSASELSREAASVLHRHLPPSRARAVAMAAVRETVEEAGLRLGSGALPDLAALDVLARAVTPPQIGKRFDAWFLTAEADRLASRERCADCGELEEIAWVGLSDTAGLELPSVTRFVLSELTARLDDPSRPRPWLRYRGGAMRRDDL